MGDVVPFIAKVRSSGDWSAAERARLQELADRLSAQGGARVETIFGATDEGDPWCVVTDESGDVLIHVARIGGKFVVHSAVDDALSEGADLHAALRERLASEVDEDASVVVPFSLGGRQAQTFLALVIAAAFFYETVDFAGEAQAAETPLQAPDAQDPPPPPLDLKAPTQERELAVQGAALAEPMAKAAAPQVLAAAGIEPRVAAAALSADVEASATLAPMPAAAAAEPARAILPAESDALRTISGTAGDDVLTGGAADERLQGGDGDDTLRGGGGADILEGGAGDDQIELTSLATAIGGLGADTFVIQAPVGLGRADTLLGVVNDFSFAEGDRLVTKDGREIDVGQPPPAESSTNGSSPPTLQGSGVSGFGPSTVAPVVGRVEVDLDGDGVIDGYVLLNFGHSALPMEPSTAGPPGESPVVVTGQSLRWDDPLG